MNGFQNEKSIVDEINGKKFNDLSDNLKKIIIYINNEKQPKSLSAKKYGGINKADVILFIDDKKYYLSVKKGGGNSVHQEPIEDFISYLNGVERNINVFNDLRHFIWGDGTLDGTGDVEDRINALIYKKEFNEKIENIQQYFDKYKVELIERALIKGANPSEDIDFLFYGNITDCFVISKVDLVDYAMSIIKKPLSVGALNFQAWNRSLNGNQEDRRGVVQFKWASIGNDLKERIKYI